MTRPATTSTLVLSTGTIYDLTDDQVETVRAALANANGTFELSIASDSNIGEMHAKTIATAHVVELTRVEVDG
jgi:hypothetical protein